MLRLGVRNFSNGRVWFNASSKLILDSHKKVPSPKELKAFLDEYIVGQVDGKKVCSVAVYNHYLRVNDKHKKLEARLQRKLLEEQQKNSESPSSKEFVSTEAEQGMRNLQRQLSLQMGNDDENLELSKSNLMVVGPSGSGKTLLATTLARMLDVPIAITDCTQLTQAGYIGEDVEVCIERLLVNADYDVSKAEKGIIVLDEVDKLAKPAASIGTKDVSGEGVQQSLLKILEGHAVELTLKRPVSKKKDEKNNQTVAKKEEVFVVDTSNILFMLMGAFVGLDKHIVKRINSIRNPEGSTAEKESDSKKLRFSNTIEHIDVGGGKSVSALNFTTPGDLVSYGIIPELIGRVPIVTALEPLKQKDLYHILKEPRNALLNQYEYIFKQFGVTLGVTEKALKLVAHFALKEGTGARGLRGIMERLLLNVNYECPNSGVSYVLVNEETVKSLEHTEHSLSTKVKAKYYSRGEQDQFVIDVYEEDEKLGKEFEKRFGRVGTLEQKGKSYKMEG
ncbi:unnamed protein product [Kluyveromyces dobzhanskii CBS 2104]|uniref:WGS project CCBQ000000000 data, contig 00015 n=1 Tax=Kluyveromyces dobzhanskii CBS 2104 TaxID=1427455 RepID=A0A0A8LCF6_9SACH|nr:unnamed protein product [Kluyveromyces dobzhanskii CBS 2104]